MPSRDDHPAQRSSQIQTHQEKAQVNIAGARAWPRVAVSVGTRIDVGILDDDVWLWVFRRL
jgi:hypothetical protein